MSSINQINPLGMNPGNMAFMSSMMGGMQSGAINTEELAAIKASSDEYRQLVKGYMSDGQMSTEEKAQLANYRNTTLSTIEQYKQDTSGTAATMRDVHNTFGPPPPHRPGMGMGMNGMNGMMGMGMNGMMGMGMNGMSGMGGYSSGYDMSSLYSMMGMGGMNGMSGMGGYTT
jgi:hypothetical protein